MKSKASKKVRTPREGRVGQNLAEQLRAAMGRSDAAVPGSPAWLEAVREYDRLARKI